MTARLDGKIAFVTGGAAGIGFAIAELFAREGAAVTIIDLNADALDSAVKKLRAVGARAAGFRAGVTDDAAVRAAVAASADMLGPAEILVNNAGTACFGTVANTTDADFDRVMAVNVTGTFVVSRAVLPAMIERGRGAIVNIGSVAALAGIPGMAAYCAAKGAIVALTRQMAADYSRLGIRTNCICPGTVGDTDLGRTLLSTDTSETAQQRRLAKYPAGRFGEPEEIAEAALYLASDAASFMTGAIVPVDGGMTAI
jgi:NAD(P)-dependent dehydrogenase (short-subunit alcohol dehydrogenase family)